MLIGREKEKSIITKLQESNKLHGSYLFFGESMIGKFSFAERLAHELENNPSVLSDALIITPTEERSTIGIDEIREVKNFLSVIPVLSKYRTVIVRDAENMTREAQNAFLKITEEPPIHSLIILVAQSVDSLYPTLTSRLRKIYFSRVNSDILKSWLINGKGISVSEVDKVAKMSFGRPGLSLKILSSDWKEISAPKDLKFETEKEYDEFIEKTLLEQYNSTNKDYKKMGDLLYRYHLSKQLNLNKKLQLKSTPWIL